MAAIFTDEEIQLLSDIVLKSMSNVHPTDLSKRFNELQAQYNFPNLSVEKDYHLRFNGYGLIKHFLSENGYIHKTAGSIEDYDVTDKGKEAKNRGSIAEYLLHESRKENAIFEGVKWGRMTAIATIATAIILLFTEFRSCTQENQWINKITQRDTSTVRLDIKR